MTKSEWKKNEDRKEMALYDDEVVISRGIGNDRSRSIVENCAAAFIILRAVPG